MGRGDEAIKEGGGLSAVRGASTIPMQTAKNLYLWNGRSYVRKALEVPLAYVMSALWPKPRMMEVYLNVAQFGPGIFGAEAASRYYFHKSAADLTRREAVLLAAALPNPRVPQPGGAEPAHAARPRAVERRMPIMVPRSGCVLAVAIERAFYAIGPWPAPRIATIRAGSKAAARAALS